MSQIINCARLKLVLGARRETVKLGSVYFSTSKVHHLYKEKSYFNYKSDKFLHRHIGPRDHDKTEMVKTLGFKVSVLTV